MGKLMSIPFEVKDWIILMVDDQPDNLVPAHRLLTGLGATVFVAKDGLQALETLTDIHPTVILTDLSMPTMSGWDLLKHIRSNTATANTLVIAVTAHALPADRTKGMEAGFDGYITKPFRPSLIIQEIRRLAAAAEPA